MSPVQSRRWSPPRRRGWLAAFAATAMIGALAAGMVLAVHDEGFQLDGNTLEDDITTGYPNPDSVLLGDFAGDWDWDSIFDENGDERASLPAGFLDSDFVADYSTKQKGGSTQFNPADPTTYTTGSKDILPISGWSCVGANNTTDKGDIINAYSTVFRNANGDRILYFGLEKYIDNGSNNVGFWFLGAGNVACERGGTGNGNSFTGNHADGDLFIVSEFTKGGGVSTIKAYRWEGGANGSLSTDPVEVGVDCVRGADSAQTNTDLCATTNILDNVPIWPHASKTLGLDNGYPPATFFEGGLNLDKTEFATSCFSDFLANTRSSQETTATLYDFAMGQINTCGSVTVTKVTGPDTTDPTDFSYTTSGPTGNPLAAAFKLDTDPADPAGDDQFPATRTWQNVPSGAYTITEAAETGWYTGALTCTKNGQAFSGSDTADASTRVASFAMGPGDNIACTYYNYKPSASLDILGDGVNRVGDSHQFTVHAYKDNGQGGGNADAAGVEVSVTLTDANGASSGGNQTCTTAADGTCSVTFDSDTTGTTTGTASATITVQGVSLNVTSSANATTAANQSVLKKWVDAAIDITGDGVNRVGDTHTFTVTTYAEGSGGAARAKTGGVDVTVHFTEANGADAIANKTCTTNNTSGDAAFGTCTVTFTSDATGINTAYATATITVEGEAISVSSKTDATTAADAEVEKKWVDAAIDITGNGVNRVGDEHTFTATTYAEGSGNAAAMDKVGGVDVTFALTDANGAAYELLTGESLTCTTEADDSLATYGTCSVSFKSLATGTTTGTASATITVEGEDIAVDTSTDATAAGAASALKKWVDAALDISGDGTNRVGDNHDFVVTAWQDTSATGGFAKKGGVTVNVQLVDAYGADAGGNQQCVTEADDQLATFGTCSVTFTSATTGTTTGTASATITVEGEAIAVTTSADAYTAGAESVLKTWIDARLSISGNGTNGIGEPHTFTALLELDKGDNNGFKPVEGGTVDVELTDAGGAVHVLDTNATTCDVSGDTFTGTGTDAAGECDVVFHSDTAGTVTGDATATLVHDGVTMNLASGDSTPSTDDDTVLKTYISGSVRWYKVDHRGDPLGGASFEVCRTHDLVSATDAYDELATPVCFDITDDDATDEDADPGELEVSGLVLGRYTVEETAAPTGYSIPDGGAGPFGFDDDMTLLDPDIERATAFVNVKLFRIIVLTCDDGTDTLVDGTVTLDGTDAQTMTPADFDTLGWKDANGDPLTQQQLCNVGLGAGGFGATFGDLEEGTYTPSVEVPDLDPFFTPS